MERASVIHFKFRLIGIEAEAQEGASALEYFLAVAFESEVFGFDFAHTLSFLTSLNIIMRFRLRKSNLDILMLK